MELPQENWLAKGLYSLYNFPLTHQPNTTIKTVTKATVFVVKVPTLYPQDQLDALFDELSVH